MKKDNTEPKEPLGVTCHNERDENGQWWIVWSTDFQGDKSGRRKDPNSCFLESAYRQGRQEVIDFTNTFAGIKHNPEWKSKLKKWGIE